LPGSQRERFWDTVRAGVAAADLFGSPDPLPGALLGAVSAALLLARRRLRGRYRRVAEELYLAVARASGASHIVDTSHYPLRARELQALEEIELYLLFAVREPHSVVASFGREDVLERRFGPLAANAYMSLTYLISTWVFLRHPRERRLLLRHEDFLAEPGRAIRQILDATGFRGPAARPAGAWHRPAVPGQPPSCAKTPSRSRAHGPPRRRGCFSPRCFSFPGSSSLPPASSRGRF